MSEDHLGRLAIVSLAAGALALAGAPVATAEPGAEQPEAGVAAWYSEHDDDDDDDDGDGDDDEAGEDGDSDRASGDGDSGDPSAPAPPPAVTAPPPPAPAPTPGAPSRRPPIASHDLVRPQLLTPALGRVIGGLRPTLRWRHPGRGIRLYNIQVYHRGRKVISVFPASRSYRVPAKRLAPGRRYVWRVWPYRARGGYTVQPFGLSWFATPPRRAGGG